MMVIMIVVMAVLVAFASLRMVMAVRMIVHGLCIPFP